MSKIRLENDSIPLTFGATIALILIIFVPAVFSSVSLVAIVFFALGTYAMAIIIISGVPERANHSGETILDIAVISFICGTPMILVLTSARQYHDVVALIFTLAFIIAAIYLASRIRDMSRMTWGEVALIPVVLISTLLLFGGDGLIGFRFLVSTAPSAVLNVNWLLRVELTIAALAWLIYGIIAGLRDNYGRFKSISNKDAGTKGSVLAQLELFVDLCQEVLVSIFKALLESLWTIFNRNSALLTISFSLTMLLMAVLANVVRSSDHILETYITSHSLDAQMLVFWLLYVATIFSATYASEAAIDFRANSKLMLDRTFRLVPLFAAMVVTIFLCSLMAHIVYILASFKIFTLYAPLARLEGFSLWLGPSFLSLVPVILVLRRFWPRLKGVTVPRHGSSEQQAQRSARFFETPDARHPGDGS